MPLLQLSHGTFMFKGALQIDVSPPNHATRGFTLVELVVVMVLVGILAAYIVPRLTLRSGFDERTLQEELVSTARYAQQLAMMRGTANGVAFIVGATDYSIEVNGVPITHPNSQPFPVNYPNGITTAAVTFTYTALGAAAPGPQTITLGGLGGLQLCIEDTGYAHTNTC